MILVKESYGMLESNPCVAYTVITKREDGKLMFLVEKNKTDFVFPLTSYEKFGTGLASVLEEIKVALNLNIDQLELAELINTIIEEQRIPLFVFNYQDETIELEKLVAPSSELQWQVSDNFTDTLKKYEISGVPNFDQE
jgi:hypothetical protein